ncbi:MAG TPA: hypothetical protein PLN21_05765 [Gemmatales bacterium]|nr:hypothetical protein [Gemmatales bacterium]
MFLLMFLLAGIPTIHADESERLKAFNTHWQAAQQAMDGKNYGQAATSYEKILETFPFEPTTHYQLACCRARQGVGDKALAALGQAISFGWCDLKQLEQTEDFKELRSRKEFTQLVADATACQKEMFVLYAGKGVEVSKAAPLVVLLQGLGAGPRTEVPYWKQTVDELGLVLVAPRGVTEIRPMFYGWHRPGAKDSTALDYYDLLGAEKRVDEAILQARSRFNIASDRMFLAGYSQGGGVALHLQGKYPERFAGTVVVNSLSQSSGIDFWKAAALKKAFRVALLSGKVDRLLPRSQAMAAQLRSAGITVLAEEEEGVGHEYPVDYQNRLTTAFKFVLNPSASR